MCSGIKAQSAREQASDQLGTPRDEEFLRGPKFYIDKMYENNGYTYNLNYVNYVQHIVSRGQKIFQGLSSLHPLIFIELILCWQLPLCVPQFAGDPLGS